MIGRYHRYVCRQKMRCVHSKKYARGSSLLLYHVKSVMTVPVICSVNLARIPVLAEKNGKGKGKGNDIKYVSEI